jgi:hypothetical protein
MTGQFCPYVSGPVLVKINLRDSNGFVNLGYTTEGVQMEETFFTNPIHSDQYGGTAGPPVDRQFMGKTARISLSLAEYSMAVVKRMREGQSSVNWTTGAAGTLQNIGGLLSCGKRAFQILLIGAADTAAEAAAVAGGATAGNTPLMAVNLNYPNCWYSGPVRFPIGSKNTVWDFDIEATPFTTDTTQSGDGKTYLFLENNHLITNLATYAAITQTAETAP